MLEEINYRVQIDVFEGPFDLLLKAIDDGKIDIHNVALSQITAAYFEYWKQQSPPLVAASGFLYMAAYLFELKTRGLLPKKEEISLEENALGDVEASLIQHIQEYQLFKKAALDLRERKEVFARIYDRHDGNYAAKEFTLVDISLKDLVLAFKKVYDQAEKREKIIPISAEEITLEKRIEEIQQLLVQNSEGLPFENLFIRKTRLEVIVTFLSILELAKQRCIQIKQGKHFGSILIFGSNEKIVAAEPVKEENYDGINAG